MFNLVDYSYFSVSSANRMVSRVSLGGAIESPAPDPAPMCSGMLPSGVSDPFPASESLDKVLSALPSPNMDRRNGLQSYTLINIYSDSMQKCFSMSQQNEIYKGFCNAGFLCK